MFDLAGQQIHDFNPGITEFAPPATGRFWTAAIEPKSVSAHPGNGKASLDVDSMSMPDYHDLVNALLNGPSVPGTATVHIEWTKSHDKQHFRDEAESWEADLVFNSATVEWSAETDEASYVSDPAAGVTVLFAESGEERNGVFFP